MQNFSLIQLAAEGILMLHYNPSVIYKNIIAFCTGSRGRLPLQVWWFLNIIPVGEGSPLPPNRRKTIGRRNASPTDILFICRGGYYPPVFMKIIFY